MDALLAFVKQKPLAPDAPNHCPSCGSTDVAVHGHEQTLVGGANHHWTPSSCLKCGLKYCYEFFDGSRGRPRNVWFTRRHDNANHVLLGMPSCFESYHYDCAACGGPVARRYTNLKGDPTAALVTTIENGRPVRQYRTFFDCGACHASIETPDSHWRPT